MSTTTPPYQQGQLSDARLKTNIQVLSVAQVL